MLKWTILASIGGLGFNVIFDPLVGYVYKKYILGINAEAASILTKWSSAATFINAIVSIILVAIIYLALRPALKKAGLFPNKIIIKEGRKQFPSVSFPICRAVAPPGTGIGIFRYIKDTKHKAASNAV